MFGIIDCNNFFASCERVFNPSLRGKPVVVLSNNDGCIIARSDESKALGIPMGAPIFQMDEIIKANNVAVYSSNYRLYGDMSNRVMQSVSQYVEEIEIYSIDEAFLNLDGIGGLADLGKLIVKQVHRSTGIPVSLGIAPTKTLAKVANRYAKKNKSETKGLFILDSEEKITEILKLTPVEDVWGIGRRYSKLLQQYGVHTAYDFVTKSTPGWVKKEMSVVGLRTWKELRGESCVELETAPSAKKTICTSRSFGKMLTELPEIEQAVTHYSSSCARKLREQKCCAGSIMVFLHTNQFRKDLPQYGENIVIKLPVASSDTMELTHYALDGLRRIYREGYSFKKAGVIVCDIVPETQVQGNLFDTVDRGKQSRLMKAIDTLNQRHGHDKIRLGSQGFDKGWINRREKLSPNYTTCLNDVIVVKV